MTFTFHQVDGGVRIDAQDQGDVWFAPCHICWMLNCPDLIPRCAIFGNDDGIILSIGVFQTSEAVSIRLVLDVAEALHKSQSSLVANRTEVSCSPYCKSTWILRQSAQPAATCAWSQKRFQVSSSSIAVMAVVLVVLTFPSLHVVCR